MELIIHKNLIYEFKNFLSLDEQQYLLLLINKLGDQWDNGSDGFWKDKNYRIKDPIMNIIDQRIKNIFQNAIHINVVDAINRFRPGDSMGPHSDEIGHNKIQYGVVLYINDDFNGGEICYPTLDFTYKPVARSLIVHPGNIEHFVNEVLDGPIRYSITTFVHGEENNPVLIKNVNS